MSARILIHANHTAREVGDAISRVWPDLLFLLYRPGNGADEESMLAPHDRLHDSSSASISIEGGMTGREVNDAFRRTFGVLVEISVESGRSVMNVPLDKAK